MKKEEFCCKEMEEAIKDDIIDYGPLLRSYGINLDKLSVKVIKYCPWCRASLGKQLNVEYFNVLLEEYGIDFDDVDIQNFTNIPLEFQSSEWWRKRGL